MAATEPSGPPGSAPPGDRLESWKEIASYLGRTPRTVQRWERQEGLPVHRLLHDKLGSVYANRSELDAWWSERRNRLDSADSAEGAADGEASESLEPAPATSTPRPSSPWRRIVLATLAGAAGLALAYGGWRSFRRPATPGPVRIAVLPFANMGGGPEQDYLSDGLTEEMIMEIGRLHPQRLGVIARTSVMRYKSVSPGIDRIGAELGVDYVLEGSVRQTTNRVKVAVKLVRVKDQTPLWAESYERPRNDVLELEGDLARSVAGQIRGRLGDSRWAGRRGDLLVAPEAYEAYLKGRYFWNQRSDDGLRKSVGLFDEAVARDPGYAAAWSGLADAYTLMANYSVMPATEAFPKAKAAARKALDLDPDLAEAHASMAFILRSYDWDFAGAEAEFRRAIALSPNNSTAQFWYAIHLESLGRFDEAAAVVDRASRLDPLSPALGGFRGTLLLTSGRYDQAIAVERKALELEPGNFGSRLNLGRALVQKGDYAGALAELRKAEVASAGHPMAVAVLGYAYGRAGRLAEARQALGRLEALSKERHVAAYYFAVVSAGLGETSQALAWLEKVYEERHVGVLSLKTDPELAGLRGDPRFQALLRKVGLPD